MDLQSWTGFMQPSVRDVRCNGHLSGNNNEHGVNNGMELTDMITPSSQAIPITIGILKRVEK
jgi:hypothetical protein